MLKFDKKTKIVATIGPASESLEKLQQLYDAGVNVFRLNFSHGDHAEHGKKIDNIRKLGLNGAIMLDTKGPEIRTGEVRGELPVKVGDKVVFTVEKGVYEDTKKISVNYPGFIDDINVGDKITIDSGVILAQATKKSGKDIEFEIIEGHGKITTKRHINLFGNPVSLPTVTEQDWKDIDFGIEKGVDMIALSFVRSGEDVAKVREYCRSKGANIQIIAKIENYEATQNLEDIVMESDGIMVARGDLACEIPYGKVPSMQKKMVALCSYYNKPVIIATQMLLSMVENIQPTRAEVSDVANAVFEHADAVMTSDETTKGVDPVHVINTMATIVKDTEEEIYNCGCCDEDCDCKDGGKCNCGEHCDCDDDCDCEEGCDCECCNGGECQGVISILPEITDDVEVIAVVHPDDEYVRNITAARLATPVIFFTNDEKIANQSNLIWNTEPVFDKAISDDFAKNVKLVDKFMAKYDVKKYLLVTDMVDGKKVCPTVQVRTL